jgi:hypothetical protein
LPAFPSDAVLAANPKKAMRTILLSAALLLGVVASADAQKQAADPVAIAILNRMADNLGALQSCSFHLDASHDAYDPNIGVTIKRHDAYQVYLVGPDKMLVNAIGDDGHRGFWYDGKVAYAYSYAENNYGRFSVPPNLIDMIDRIHEDYGIDFPAADLLYPTFVDDLIAQSQKVIFRKTVKVGDQDCFHIVAKGADQDVELWIANDGANLPVKYLFRTRDKEGATEYEGTFADFRMNPELPAPMFSFTPPPGAHEVRMLPRTQPKKTGGKK